VNGTIIDIILFVPGVTASLVNFLVFGTAKSWKQYRNLIVSGCGCRKKRLERSINQNDSDQEQPLEFERLPSLQNTPSAEERMRNEEAKNRIKMFSREIRRPSTTSTAGKAPNIIPPSTGPSFHRPNNSNTSNQFHLPRRPSQSQITRHNSSYSTTGEIPVGMAIDPEDQVIQADNSQFNDVTYSHQHFEQPRRHLEYSATDPGFETLGSPPPLRYPRRNTAWPRND
jgi:hypothetical protein